MRDRNFNNLQDAGGARSHCKEQQGIDIGQLRTAQDERLSVIMDIRNVFEPLNRARSLFQYLRHSRVKPLYQLHAAAKEFFITDSVFRPANKGTIQTQTLRAAELLVIQICVVNDLCNGTYATIPNREFLAKGLKSTVVSLVPEPPCLEHIEGNGVWMTSRIIVKDELGAPIDEVPNQPGRRHSINSWTRPCYPDPITIGFSLCAGPTGRR